MLVSVSPIEPRRMASAKASSGVGSRLMITSRAPCSLAVRGKLAAGVTTSDEPMASIRSASRDQPAASISTSGGSDLAERDGGVLEPAAAGRAIGNAVVGQKALHERIDVVAGRAIEAGGLAGRAVELQHLAAAGHLVQAVDVLRDYAADAAGGLPAGENLVAGVGLGVRETRGAFRTSAASIRGGRSALSRNSSKYTVRYFDHTPPGERKSGMPLSVLMPAPVSTTADFEARKPRGNVLEIRGNMRHGGSISPQRTQRARSGVFRRDLQDEQD